MRARIGFVGGLVAAGTVLTVAACTQLIGVEDIPTNTPPADGGKPGDSSMTGDVRVDHHDAAMDVTPPCEASAFGMCITPCESGTTRCAGDGLGTQSCADGKWQPPVACGPATPVCLGGACSCEPGTTQCAGQQFQACAVGDAGFEPTWITVGAPCKGTCSLSGCGAVPPSCASASLDAGTQGCSAGTESCCTTREVSAGVFSPSFDDYSTGDTVKTAPVGVSAFRLDRYEVTVGRFREFFAALAAPDGGTGWRPAAGAGKHVHLNGGQGLYNRSTTAYETGWNPVWDADLAPATVSSELVCGGSPDATWSAAPGGDEFSPVNCVSWPVAYAFCIWDGGFLPSEDEWNYAAAGGPEQRIYPWSPPLGMQRERDSGPDESISCDNANYVPANRGPCALGPVTVGSYAAGDGRWGQADLAGNVLEWTLDVYAPYSTTSCTDCAALGSAPGALDADTNRRVQRGGGFVSAAAEVLTSFRGYNPEQTGSYTAGFRCARTP